MKILYIISTLKSCGPVHQLLYLIKYLDRSYFEPAILTLSPEPSDSLADRFQKLNVPVYSLALSRWQGIVVAASKLKHFVAKYRPDIIHTHGFRPDILAAKHLLNYRKISTIHNYPLDDYPLKYGKLIGNYTANRHFSALKKIDFPVACSHAIKKMLEQHQIKLQAIQNGVDEQIYTPATLSEKIHLRQKLGLPKDTKIFITVGSLIPRKQPEKVIQGFLASAAKKKAQLLIVGDGVLREQCETLAQSASSIQFTGQINNVAEYLKAADCFVSASQAEGLPCSVIEALACGIPVCLSNIEPHQEILKLNPQAGVLFTGENFTDLANKLDLLMEIDVHSLTEAALTIVQKHLNAKTMSEKYQFMYNS